MKIVVTSVMVDDQEKACRFYTETLGFVKKHDIPMGQHRWLTARESLSLLNYCEFSYGVARV